MSELSTVQAPAIGVDSTAGGGIHGGSLAVPSPSQPASANSDYNWRFLSRDAHVRAEGAETSLDRAKASVSWTFE